jgi:hypothetical protein
MLPPEERVFFQEDSEVIGLSAHTGSSEGRSSSSGINGMSGSSAGHARSRMLSESDSESSSTSFSNADTAGFSESEGWSSGWNESHGAAQTEGESEAWTRGTNRSTTRGHKITNSESVTDGYSDTVGKTFTRGQAFTEGETTTHGESFTVSPFYEYDREEIEAPTFLTPEEQKLLVMQKLARIPKMHFLIKAPESNDCIIRAPYVGDPIITKRRLAAGLQSVYNALPCYTSLEHRDDGDVIDVEVHEVCKPQRANALPAPAEEDETALWQRWQSMSHRAPSIPSPAADDTDDEPVFWRPATEHNERQEKS